MVESPAPFHVIYSSLAESGWQLIGTASSLVEWKEGRIGEVHQDHQGLGHVACEELLREQRLFSLKK